MIYPITQGAFFNEITPEHGVGYALGIVGGVLMLLLLVYPLKKRLRGLSLPFSAKFWFKVHMGLGLLGPTFIFVHSRLNTGSTNSAMAFWFMVTVMASGLVGRYLYRQVHLGLYGRRKQLDDLLSEVDRRVGELPEDSPLARELAEKARYLRDQIPRFGSLASLMSRRRRIRNAVRHFFLSASAREVLAGGIDHRLWVRRFDESLSQCISYHVYEKLFSWWHFLHLPIFFAFVVSVVVHIWAVHYY